MFAWLSSGILWALAGTVVATSQAQVGMSPGELAVRPENSPSWRIAANGEDLSAPCFLRTADGSPGRVEIPGGTLHVGPDSRLKLDAASHRLVVESGRVALRLDHASRWTIHVANMIVEVEGQSIAELSAANNTATVHVLRGSAIGRNGPAGKPVPAVENTTLDADPAGKCTVRPLSADDRKRIETWTVAAKPSPGLGQLVVTNAQSQSPVRLDIAACHVNVVLHPPVAIVQLDQSFYNPHPRQQEGTFVFNLPQGASVSRFAMFVERDRLVEGELIDRRRAAKVYQTIVDRQRDPAILEKLGDNLFKIRVFPIPSLDTKRILLDFTLPLPDDEHGRYAFNLPLLADLEPILDFRLSGTILGPTQLQSVCSPSHPAIQFEPTKGGAIEMSWAKANYRPVTPLSLQFAQKPPVEPVLRCYVADDRSKAEADKNATERKRWVHFLAQLPPDADREANTPSPADVLILADTSWQTRGRPELLQTVRTIVRNLRQSDRFRLASVDLDCHWLDNGWTTPGTPAAQGVVDNFARQLPMGVPGWDGVLAKAMAAFNPPGKRRQVVIHVGDSLDLFEAASTEAREAWIRSGVQLVLALLDDPGDERMQMESARKSGVLVLEPPGTSQHTTGWFGWILAGMPSAERILRASAKGAAEGDVFCAPMRLPGQTLYVYGRVPAAEQVQLELVTSLDGQPRTRSWPLNVAPHSDDVFVGRLWAQHRLDWLEATTPIPDPSGIADQRIALEQEWTLLGIETAFLVLERDEDYARWNIDRRVRHRYWKPTGVRQETPVPPGWAQSLIARRDTERRQHDSDRALKLARLALADNNFTEATRLLFSARRPTEGPAAKEFDELERRIRQDAQRQGVLADLGWHQALLDASQRRGKLSLDLGDLMLMGNAASPEFLARHPHALGLLHEERFGCVPMSIDNLASWLRHSCGTNVAIDRRSLDELGVSPEGDRNYLCWGRISFREYARFVLQQNDLVLLDEPYRLLITSGEYAANQLSTEVYPVADLLLGNRVAPPGLLGNPYLDRESAAHQRISEKLRKPISVKFDRVPLVDVIDHFARQLDDAMVVDTKALDELGLRLEPREEPAPQKSSNEPADRFAHPPASPQSSRDADRTLQVTAEWNNVPAGLSLGWILKQFDLTYVIDGEMLMITNRDRADNHLSVRLHSLRGLISGGHDRVQSDSLGMGAGMGMGGGFGGGMGGSGGMGGGMGGSGGSFGGPAGPSERTSSAPQPGLSSGGDGSTSGSSAPETTIEPPQTVRGEESGLGLPGGGMGLDFDSWIDLIVGTVRPESWDEVGGRGSIRGIERTLDLAIATTDDIHQEINELLDRLRKMPVEAGDRIQQTPYVGADPTIDADGLIDLITSTVHPESWEEVGGRGSIRGEESRLALVINTDSRVHDGVETLLTMLHRRRYDAVHGSQAWDRAASDSIRLAPLLGFRANPATQSRTPRRPAKPEELALLAVRREPGEGSSTWQQSMGRRSPETLSLQRSGNRMELRSSGCIVRIGGEGAVVASLDLLLLETDVQAEDARHWADVQLPWLPHRTNQELAQLFQIREVPPRDDDARQGLVRLRLDVPGCERIGRTGIEAVFAREHGLPVAWDTYLEGQLTGRLRFQGLQRDGGTAYWEEIVLENAAGNRIMRWKSRGASSPSPIADLQAGWGDYIQFTGPRADSRLADARAAMWLAQWNKAARLLQQTSAAKRHPLVPLLWAWCWEQDPQIGSRDDYRAALGEVAAGPARGMRRFLAQDHLAKIKPDELYAILASRPQSQRDADDWENLARAALRASQYDKALEHVNQALKAADSSSQFRRSRLRTEILLAHGRKADALREAETWLQQSAPVDELIPLADLLTRHEPSDLAVRLLQQAEASDVTGPDRSDLLQRLAGRLHGPERCRVLVELAEGLSPKTIERRKLREELLAELDHSHESSVAAALAARTRDPRLRADLLIKQAQLTPEAAVAFCDLSRPPPTRPTARTGVGCSLPQCEPRRPSAVDHRSPRRRPARRAIPRSAISPETRRCL